MVRKKKGEIGRILRKRERNVEIHENEIQISLEFWRATRERE
jgi:hypothetical protein